MLIFFCVLGVMLYLLSGKTLALVGCLVGIVVCAFVEHEASIKMQQVAKIKGYENLNVASICFWFGIMGYFYVVALPDLVLRKKVDILLGVDDSEEESSLEEKLVSVVESEISPEEKEFALAALRLNNERLLSEGGWQCTQCGRVNAGYVGTCCCGKHIPVQKTALFDALSKVSNVSEG